MTMVGELHTGDQQGRVFSDFISVSMEDRRKQGPELQMLAPSWVRALCRMAGGQFAGPQSSPSLRGGRACTHSGLNPPA